MTGVIITASQAHVWGGSWIAVPVDLGLLHLSISVSLNILLTLMIVTRLVLHGRIIRTATGTPAGTSRLYNTMATMFIESSALFSVNSLVLIGLWASGSSAAGVFPVIIAETQVRTLQATRGSRQVVMTYFTGDRSTANHSTSRQPNRVDEQHICHQTHQFEELGGLDGR